MNLAQIECLESLRDALEAEGFIQPTDREQAIRQRPSGGWEIICTLTGGDEDYLDEDYLDDNPF